METEKFDLTALDPTTDPGRWEAFVEATLVRADRVLRARLESENDVFWLIARWRRPLVGAAAVFLGVLVPTEFLLEQRASRAEAVHRLATVSITWVERNRGPSGAEILRTIAEARTP